MANAVHEAFFVMAAATAVGLVVVLWFPRVLSAPEDDEPVGDVTMTSEPAAVSAGR
jgi:hypothetical protein